MRRFVRHHQINNLLQNTLTMIRFVMIPIKTNIAVRLIQGLAAMILSIASVCASADRSQLTSISVTKSSIPKIMELDGEIEAVRQATVAAQTSGRVVEMLYDVGDYVPANSVIVRLTSVEQGAHLDTALSRQKEAETLLQEAKDNFERARSVFAKQLISKADFDRAEANFRAAEAQAEAARAAVTTARENLAYTTITAPYAGIVVERLVQPGETVSPGTPIMSGVSLQELRVIVHVPQLHIGPIRQYQKAHVVLPDGTSVKALSMRIPPQAEPDSHTFRVLVDLPGNVETVFPGTLVKVQFVVGEENRLTIPQEALVKRGEVTAAYVVGENGTLTLRYVRVGQTFAERVTVLSGLQEGDKIVTDPSAAAGVYKIQQVRGASD